MTDVEGSGGTFEGSAGLRQELEIGRRGRVPWSALLDEKLAPAPGAPERAEYVRWLVLATTGLQPAVVEAMLAQATGNEAALASARETFTRYAAEVETAVDARGHLIGDSLTAADLVVSSLVTWAASIGLVDPSAKVAEYAKRVAQR
jgi:glutathione S-transferase